MKVSIYRYDPDADVRPNVQDIEMDSGPNDHVLLDLILRQQAKDPSQY
jgi:succinate dehydrogenase / fumarate reductase, iron-sulfur subunit